MLAGFNHEVEKQKMDAAMKGPQDDRPSDVEWQREQPASGCEENMGALQAEVERLRQRERQIMTLIGCKNAEKLMHDLLNVLNELQLLRMLAESDKA